MAHADAAGGEVRVDGGLVLQHALAAAAVHDAHDLRAAEALAAAAPVTVRHADVAPALGAGALLLPGLDGPVEETAGPRAAGAAVAAVGVVQEGGEAADDAAAIEIFSHAVEVLGSHADGPRAGRPGIGNELVGPQALLEREQHLPLLLAELGARGALHHRRSLKLVTRAQPRTAHVPDAQRKHADNGQRGKILRTDDAGQQAAVRGDAAVARGHLERRPEAVVAAGGGGVVRLADDDVPGEGIIVPQPVVGGLQPLLRQLPGDEGAVGQAGGEQCLAHAADGAGAQHGAQALDDELFRQLAGAGNGEKGAGVEAVDAVLRHGENAAVDGVTAVGRDGGLGEVRLGCWWNHGGRRRAVVGGTRVRG